MLNSKTYLLATTLLAGVAMANPAFAQATSPASPPSQDPNVQAAPTDQTPAQQENVLDTAAQDRQDVEPAAAETIVVTGSRIVSPNIVSLAPVQVVGEQDIDTSGAINVQEVLLENPVFGTPALSTTNSAFLTSGAGIATVDLRDLGSNRTLILINGRRVVGGLANSPIVDLNVIPTQFIERVDILTGGASSLYGSDAVAGVVNFIYKRNFQGLLAEGQYGITQKGDSQRYQVNATVGTNFIDNRGNLMFHVGYTKERGLLSRQRKNTRVDDIDKFLFYGDPADAGVPYEPYFSSFTPQGRFFAGASQFTFNANGDLQPCFTSNAASCGGGAGIGPNGFNRQFFRTLSTPVERYLIAERGHFDITDDISFITEATYAKTTSKTEIEPFPSAGPADPGWSVNGQANIENLVTTASGAQIVVRNPFVPDAIFDAATDTNGDGLRDISFTKRLVGIGQRTASAKRDFFRIVTGFEGKLLDRFTWDLTYNYGRTDEAQESTGQYNVVNGAFAFASVQEDAATGDLNGNGNLGDIVCVDPNARASGCVAFNPFGFDSITPTMANYLRADAEHLVTQTQQVVAANLSGSIFDMPAGPLGIAIGAEYRKEKSSENWDALTNAGLNAGNALPDTSGQFDVKEVFGEVNVPIFKDQPFAQQLNLRAAGRLSDYSTVGSVATWSLGADYAPIEAVRFRGTYAKAVRAPNIGELFTGPSQTFPTGLTDPCENITAGDTSTLGQNCLAAPGVAANIALNGAFTLNQADNQGISGFTSGNPNLGPETAKTFTVGVVVAPRSIPALRNLVFTADYYDIKVEDEITFLGRQTILNLCYQSSNLGGTCGFIIRRPAAVGANSAGSLAFINLGGINGGELKERGVDLTLTYRTGLGALLGGGLNMNARVAYTHLFEGYEIPVVGATDKDPFVGEVGTAKDRVNASVAFNTSKWGLSFTGNYIGKSYQDDVFLDTFDLGPHAVSYDPEFYLDTQLSFQPTRTYEFYVGVDNLLDNDPPNILNGMPFNVTGADTAADVYDIFGRRFYAGARLRF
jgi:outer membrane receptor protein involved in Fe transport